MGRLPLVYAALLLRAKGVIESIEKEVAATS